MVVIDVLLGRRADVPHCDAVLCIVDASNLERNLYLVSQVLEFGLPTVLALNMTDIAEERGLAIDVPKLSQQLGVPVVPLQANKRRGIEELKSALAAAIAQHRPATACPFPPAFCDEVARLDTVLNGTAAAEAAGFRPQNAEVPNRTAPARRWRLFGTIGGRRSRAPTKLQRGAAQGSFAISACSISCRRLPGAGGRGFGSLRMGGADAGRRRHAA